MKKLPKPNALPAANKGGRAVVSFDTGVKSSLVVTCALHPLKATEYLLLIADRTAHAGAKNPITKTGDGGSFGQKKSIAFDYLETINGVTQYCLICSNNRIIQCGNCNAMSCATEGKNHVCPSCKRVAPSIHIVIGKDYEASKKAPPKQGRKLLQKSTSGSHALSRGKAKAISNGKK